MKITVMKHDSKYFFEAFYSENFNTIQCTNSGVELQLRSTGVYGRFFLPLLFITKGKTPKYLMLYQVHYISLIY